MIENFSYWLFLFFLFNVMGWLIESTVESINHKGLINRGFLNGPYIPIYGAGGILFALVGLPLKSAFGNAWLNVFLVFFVGMSLATLLEYMVGSALERIFKKQFWDYSTLKLTYKFTYKNRISLVSSLFFGVLALFQTYFLYERVSSVVLSIDFRIINAINIVMTLIVGADAIIQIRRQTNFRSFFKSLPPEQLRALFLGFLMRVARTEQIREFRDVMFKNAENVKENFKRNIRIARQNIRKNARKVKRNVKKNVRTLKSKIKSEGTQDK
ncbi:MAG: putative ABC transporter permease [Oscillospiraceae bacterium]|nr:putative ABC transporter permease [Oscillospiraceae bacterium]